MELETERRRETNAPEGAAGLPLPQFEPENSRARTSLRQKYEAEARVLERRIGSLETIRANLGLSQRKMAQLLLVDPSAWTRWTSGQTEAPPHVWRSLAWYLALQEKYPALDTAFWLQGVARLSDSEISSQVNGDITALKARIQELEKTIETQRRATPAELQEAKETRAIANFFLAVVFTALGAVLASYFL